LALRAGATELQGLLGTLPEPDTVNLAGLFFSRRQVGRSRRGLPLWEEDSYRRWSRVPWDGTTVLYPFGPPGVGQRRVVWVEITVSRAFAAGETRASEEATIIDSADAFSAQPVMQPRPVTVSMWLGRGDSARRTRVRAQRSHVEGDGRLATGARSDVSSTNGPQATARPRALPPPRREDAGGLLLRQILRPHPRAAAQGRPPPMRDDAGVRQGPRVPRRHRRGDRDPQALQHGMAGARSARAVRR